MDISGLSSSGLVSLAQSLSANKLQDNIGIAVLELANDQTKQDGENILQLINSTTPVGPLGHNIDVKA